jgi:hypothetical protein
MNSINKKLQLVFWISLLLSIIILLVPMRYKFNNSPGYYLDWFLVFILTPINFIILIWLIKLNLKKIKRHTPNQKKLNLYYYISLFISIIIYVLPTKYKMAMYTPNYLGLFWLFILIPIMLILFIWLLILDIKKKDYKELIKRILIFVVIISFCIGYWFYRFYKIKELGNI